MSCMKIGIHLDFISVILDQTVFNNINLLLTNRYFALLCIIKGYSNYAQNKHAMM